MLLGINKDGAKILTLHQIVEKRESAVIQNSHLEVSIDSMVSFIVNARAEGYEFSSIDGLYSRLQSNRSVDKLYVLTADDGYKNNFHFSMDVLREYDVPICIYVGTSFPEKTIKLWWYALEDALLDTFNGGVGLESRGDFERLNKIFNRLKKKYQNGYDSKPEEFFHKYFPEFNLEWKKYHENSCLTWSEIKRMNQSDLVTIGSHGISHSRLSNLSDDKLFYEMRYSKKIIEKKIGADVEHFSYPYGGRMDAYDREYDAAKKCGYKTAVTTCYGVVNRKNKYQMMSLPRISYLEGMQPDDLNDLRLVAKNLIKKMVFVGFARY